MTSIEFVNIVSFGLSVCALTLVMMRMFGGC